MVSDKPSSVSSVWVQRNLGVSLPKDLASELHSNVEYISNFVYPFAQLVNANAVFSGEAKVELVDASTGWSIHDYGEAISVSAQHNISATDSNTPKSKKSKDDDKEGGDASGSGGGGRSIIEQIATMADIAILILFKGWKEVELIAGSTFMKRLLWIESRRCSFALKGYVPSLDDERCHDRLLKNAKANGFTWERKIQKPELNMITTAS